MPPRRKGFLPALPAILGGLSLVPEIISLFRGKGFDARKSRFSTRKARYSSRKARFNARKSRFSARKGRKSRFSTRKSKFNIRNGAGAKKIIKSILSKRKSRFSSRRGRFSARRSRFSTRRGDLSSDFLNEFGNIDVIAPPTKKSLLRETLGNAFGYVFNSKKGKKFAGSLGKKAFDAVANKLTSKAVDNMSPKEAKQVATALIANNLPSTSTSDLYKNLYAVRN